MSTERRREAADDVPPHLAHLIEQHWQTDYIVADHNAVIMHPCEHFEKSKAGYDQCGGTCDYYGFKKTATQVNRVLDYEMEAVISRKAFSVCRKCGHTVEF